MTTISKSFTSREVPWSKIGKTIDDPDVDAAEAARLGGIDFDVQVVEAGFRIEHEPVHDADGTQLTSESGNPIYVDRFGERTVDSGYWMSEPSRRSIVREDTKQWFSFVSTDYRPVQFREAFAFMDGVNPRYVAAGAMTHGRQGFMVVKLPEQESLNVVVNGEEDPHDLYVVLQTSHDLSRGINIALTPLRNRCMNMLTLPSFDRSVPQNWSIRHVGDPHAKLEQAQLTLERAGRYGELYERMVAQYASVRITDDDLRQIARRAFPKYLKTVDAQVEAVVDKFKNADTVGYNQTGWGAINAVSEYLQWGRTSAVRTEQSEFTSPLDGAAAKIISNAAQLVMTRA